MDRSRTGAQISDEWEVTKKMELFSRWEKEDKDVKTFPSNFVRAAAIDKLRHLASRKCWEKQKGKSWRKIMEWTKKTEFVRGMYTDKIIEDVAKKAGLERRRAAWLVNEAGQRLFAEYAKEDQAKRKETAREDEKKRIIEHREKLEENRKKARLRFEKSQMKKKQKEEKRKERDQQRKRKQKEKERGGKGGHKGKKKKGRGRTNSRR